MKQKNDIPEGVVDNKAYKKYLIYCQHSILRNPYFTTTNNEEINISMLPHMLRNKISHLGNKEQENILLLKDKWMEMNAKRNVLCSVAFGKQGKGKKSLIGVVPFEEDIKELLGKMFSIEEVVRIMVADNGLRCTEDQVKKILRENIADIEKMREGFRNKINDCRLYNKRSRLEELSWMYGEMKLKYINLEGNESYFAMLRTLEQIRKESEGDILNINGAFEVTIEGEIQQHIYQEIYKTINLREIILGRVAARMNYDYGKLIAGLHNGYYSKFVEISGNFDPNEGMKFPSTQNYDFSKISEPGGHDEVIITMEDKPEEVVLKIKDSGNNIRDLLMKKINEEKELIKQKQLKVKAESEIFIGKNKNIIAVPEDSKIKNRGVGSSQDKKLESKKTRGKAIYKDRNYYNGKKIKKK